MALSEKQKALRRQGIGASEVAVLAGVSKWSTPAAIFESKVRPPAEDDSSLPMDLGNEFEDPIARVYAKRHNRFLAKVGTIVHPKKRFAIATPDRAVFLTAADLQRAKDARVEAIAMDGLDDDPELLTRAELDGVETLAQVKSTTWRQKEEWGPPGTDQVPEWHGCQCQYEMGVAEVPRNQLVVLWDKDKIETYPLVYSAEIFEGLYVLVERFMVDHVLKGVPPPPDASERYTEFVQRWFPKHTKVALEPAPAEFEELALRYAKLWTFNKRLKGHLKLAKNQLRAAIGERAGFESARFGKVTWKAERPRMTTDWRKVAEDSLQFAGQLLSELRATGLSEETALAHTNRLLGLATAHAKPAAPRRPLKAFWKGEAKAMAQLLEMKLDALEVGESDEDYTTDDEE